MSKATHTMDFPLKDQYARQLTVHTIEATGAWHSMPYLGHIHLAWASPLLTWRWLLWRPGGTWDHMKDAEEA